MRNKIHIVVSIPYSTIKIGAAADDLFVRNRFNSL